VLLLTVMAQVLRRAAGLLCQLQLRQLLVEVGRDPLYILCWLEVACAVLVPLMLPCWSCCSSVWLAAASRSQQQLPR
jgi:hypothetical protein